MTINIKKNCINLFKSGKSSNLAEILSSRDNRAEKQRELIQQYNLPIISLTLVIPGDIKKSEGSLLLFNEAMLTLYYELNKHKFTIVNSIKGNDEIEYSAFFIVECSAKLLKKICYQFEESHPLGRLWDFDVIDPLNGLSISRDQLDLIPRKCLICNDNAKNCARSRKHTLDELYNHLSFMVKEFT